MHRPRRMVLARLVPAVTWEVKYVLAEDIKVGDLVIQTKSKQLALCLGGSHSSAITGRRWYLIGSQIVERDIMLQSSKTYGVVRVK